MSSSGKIRGGRINQKLRTRKEILRAAERLLGRGESPTLETIAEEAMVSRATVYRYYANVDMLLAEAPLDAQTLDAEGILSRMPLAEADNAVERAVRVHEHIFDVVGRNESRFRHFLKASMEQWIANEGKPRRVIRGARRVTLLDSALEPVRGRLDRGTYEKLRSAIAMMMSIEGYVALTDVCGLNRKKGREVGSWAIRTLVSAVVEQQPRHKRGKGPAAG